jgi:RNA polymerase sigma-70 factor (ECF subfamily)
VLCDLQEMSYVEAAATLGCAVGTVRSRLHRGRALLLEKFRSVPEIPAPPVRARRAVRANGR